MLSDRKFSGLAGVMALALGALCSNALAVVEVVKLSGDGTITNTSITYTTTGARVKFTGTPTGSISVAVQADSITEIDLVEVEVNKAGAAIAQVQLIVRAKPGTTGKVTRVGTVRQISADSTTDGELIIENITTDLGSPGDGNIGARGSTRGGEIRAPIVSTLNCAGNLTANVTASGRADGSQSSINHVNVLNSGHLLGDLRATQGVVGNVTVEGDIGAEGAAVQPQIIARDGVRKISCTNFFGVIDTTRNGALGNYQRLETFGHFKGSLTTNNLAIVDPFEPTRGIFIGGDLAGAFNFAQSTISTVTIVGSLTGSYDTGSIASDNPISDPSRDTDFVLGSIGPTGRFSSRGGIGAPVTINGPMDGAFTVGSVAAPANLNNFSADSISGSVTIHGNLNASRFLSLSGNLMPSGAIQIGASLLGTISLPDSGLQGAILVNANMPSPAGAWSGTVRVGSTSLTNPVGGEYPDLPISLGGGSAALAPYKLHKAGSAPQHDSAIPVLTSAFAGPWATPVVIRSYGPMTLAAGLPSWDSATVIQRETSPGSCSWVNAEEAFSVSLADQENGRLLIVSPSGAGLPLPGRYRLVPTGIRCRDVANSPAVVWPNTCGVGAFVFSVAFDCDGDGAIDPFNPADFSVTIPDSDLDGIADKCETNGGGGGSTCPCDSNNDQTVAVADIFEYLNTWFEEFPGTGPGLSADFDDDQAITVADIFAYLNCWFALFGPCP